MSFQTGAARGTIHLSLDNKSLEHQTPSEVPFIGSSSKPEPGSSLERAQDQFILEWGRMSSSWGINRTMAQIHALLFVSGVPLEVNEIMERLQISRGNASMNLRELMDWGVVRRFRHPGERKDTYVSESDPYQMFVRIIKERKRREIDPTADAIKEVVEKIPEDDPNEGARALRLRLEALLEIFGLLNVVYNQVFGHGELSLEELKQLVKNSV